MRFAEIAVTCAAACAGLILTAGCQSAPSAPPPAPPRTPFVASDQPYFTADVPDEDAPTDNLFSRGMTRTGVAISSGFGSAMEGPLKLYKFLSGDRPSDSARKMEDSNSPDHRREGINELLTYDFTKREPYTRRYRQISQFDDDATVRAVAVRASNRSRDPNASAALIRGLNDKSELVRLEAAKALVHLPDMDAVTPLIHLVSSRDEDRDVRIAAADALKHYRTLTVARALVGVLNERDFAIGWQARQSLRYLTAQDYQFDEEAWLSYFTGREQPVG